MVRLIGQGYQSCQRRRPLRRGAPTATAPGTTAPAAMAATARSVAATTAGAQAQAQAATAPLPMRPRRPRRRRSSSPAIGASAAARSLRRGGRGEDARAPRAPPRAPPPAPPRATGDRRYGRAAFPGTCGPLRAWLGWHRTMACRASKCGANGLLSLKRHGLSRRPAIAAERSIGVVTQAAVTGGALFANKKNLRQIRRTSPSS
mmetsp:Transcript_29574/g.64272  ORF Transcript_29574/g.64272 Transcript_29574/m.64272 type:complete len:204 (+) Transcript_29574:104-715(+)